MAGRTFAIGDIHGELTHLDRLLDRLPELDRKDTMVFLGDFIDRGPNSAGVVARIKSLAAGATPARVVLLRGNHEDAWLKVRQQGWIEFVLPVGNGCFQSYRSFTGGAQPSRDELPTLVEFDAMQTGSFFPAEIVDWMGTLLPFYEDKHAIYVHAGLPQQDGRWLHPSEIKDPKPLFWQRTQEFFRSYRGKRVVFGHTATEYLPQELSSYTPNNRLDLFANRYLLGIDTRCGNGGYLTAIELPRLIVYESR